MTSRTEGAAGDAVASTEPRRAGRELLLEALFRPLSVPVVRVCARAGLAPPVVVVANAVTGLAAALTLAWGQLVGAAVLLQVKSLLDNVDGRLARETGRVSLAGRYLDTEADLLVNAAVFAALGYVTGRPLLAGAAFVALTLLLAVDFNVTELYRDRRGLTAPAPPRSGSTAERVLERVYAVVFEPLDRLVRAFSERRFARLSTGRESPGRVAESWLAYVDSRSVTVLANMGLTTQLAVLGVCLVLGVPEAYLWLVLAALLALVPLQLRAERRARSVLRQTAPRSVTR